MENTIIELVRNVAELQTKMNTIWGALIFIFATSAGALITNFIQIRIIKDNGFGYCPPKKKARR